MAFQKKFDSVVCKPEQVGDTVNVWDARGYAVEGMAATITGVGNGHGPIVVLLFRLKERKP